MTMQQPGAFHRHHVGAIEVIALLDGSMTASLALFPEPERPALARIAAQAGLDPEALPLDVQAFVIRTAGRTILVDTGTGPSRGPGLGHAGAALAAAGIAPEAIDTVFMTHLHGDHAGALVGADGTPLYPNATLVLDAAERAFWSDPGLAARSPDRMQPTIAQATRALDAWSGRVRTVEGEAEIAPGVTSVPLPGHTPGHCGLLIEDGGERLLLLADLFHVAALQAPRPDLVIMFDIDGEEAVATRRRALARVVREGLPVGGMHLPFPGVGTIRAEGEGYAYEPA